MSKIQVNDIVNHFDDGAPNFPKGIAVGGGATLGLNVGTGASIYSPSDNVLTLGTNNSERLRITSAGLVGINTTPGTLLELKGESGKEADVTFNRQPVQSTNDGVIGQLLFENATDSVAQISVKRESAADDAYIQVATQTTGGSFGERLRITSDGRTLIHTSTAAGYSDRWLSIGDVTDASSTLEIRSSPTNGYSNIVFSDATSADSNSYIGAIEYAHQNNTLAFKTNALERLRINSDSKLILSGTQRTTPFISGDGGMCIEQNYDGNLRALSIRNKSTDAAAATSMCFSLNRSGGDQDFTAGEIKLEKEQSWTTSSATVDGAMVFSTILNGTMAEKVRITSGGSLLVGTTSDSLTIQGFQVASGQIKVIRGTNGDFAKFYATGTGTQIGAIRNIGGTGTSYIETSDYRLKENVVDITDGITRLKQLQPRRFNFIVDPDTTIDGFIAHEAQPVVPQAVCGTKDEVDENNDPVLQGIDKSKLVPLLTAALQEAITKIETLETQNADLLSRVTALEGS